MKSILDPTFKYISSDKTDIRKTFMRIRQEAAKNSGTSGQAGSVRTAQPLCRGRSSERK